MLVQTRHGARFNSTAKSIPHDQLGTCAPLGNEERNLGEVVAVISISHDNELSLGFFDSLAQRVSIAL